MRADELLVETVGSLLGDHCVPERITAAEGGMDAALWALVEDAGLTLVGVPEAAGGSGGTIHDSTAIVRAIGEHASPVPVADTMLAAGWAAASSLPVPRGPMAVAIERPGFAEVRVPWGPVAEHVVVVSARGVAVVPVGDVRFGSTARNYAGEPVGVMRADDLRAYSFAQSPVDPDGALVGAALARAILVSGGLQRAVDLSVQYANEREQFGKPIGRFQILQHYLSEMAGEAAAAGAAADNVIDMIATGSPQQDCQMAAAAAKAYAGRAVGTVTRLAHQLHGAIGYTDEHRLQHTTRRLWSWRDEFGSESEWAQVLGRHVAADGGAALWPRITEWPRATA